MIKRYELLVLVFFSFFIIYNNLSFDKKKSIDGCMDLNAINYNPIASINCCCEYLEDSKVNCYDNNKFEHPCLCTFNIKTNMSCDVISNESTLYSIESLQQHNLDQGVYFNELVYSASMEYFYSKLMHISNVLYMDYYQVDGVNSIKNPQYLFFLAIEFLKIGEYDKALSYIDRFINIPNNYKQNKFNPNKAFFVYYGCCENDLEWLENKNHKSYSIANKLKDILIILKKSKNINDIKTQNYELINNIEFLKNLDETKNTIDLIENIIFSIIHSIDDLNDELFDLRDDLFNGKKNIQISSFNKIFEGSIPEYYLSSQIDILVFLKMKNAESNLHALVNNNTLNSLNDIESIQRFFMLRKKYNKNFYEPNFASATINSEFQNILHLYDEVKNKSKIEDDSFEVFEGFDFEEDNSIEDEIINQEIAKLDNMVNLERATIINDGIIRNINDLNDIDFKSFGNEDLNYFSFFNYLDKVLEYNTFIQLIDKNSKYDHFPVINQNFKDKINVLKNSNYISEEKNNYEIVYFFKKNKNSESNSTLNLKKYDLFFYDILYDFMNVAEQSGAQKLKGNLIKIHNEKEIDLDLNVGYKSLISSITLWQIVLPD